MPKELLKKECQKRILKTCLNRKKKVKIKDDTKNEMKMQKLGSIKKIV